MRKIHDFEVESTETEIRFYRNGKKVLTVPRNLWSHVKNAAVYVPEEELK